MDGGPRRGDPQRLPIDGVLDLHMFRPDEAGDLVRDYLEACLEEGVLDVRIIHGKGIGVLRTIVRKILADHLDVEDFGQPNDAGSWGATVVRLRPRRREE